MRKMDIKSIEILCGLRKASNETLISQKLNRSIPSDEETGQPEFNDNFKENGPSKIFENSGNTEKYKSHGRTKPPNTNEMIAQINKLPIQFSKTSVDEQPESHSTKESNQVDGHSSKRDLKESKPETLTMNSSGERSQNAILSKENSNTKIENHFIDVGSLTFGSIFGLGEKLEHRVIMARTTVQCLMLPRFWLFEKEQNPGNIWQRRRFYLDTTIPSRQTLFTDFLTTRKWQKFKKDLIESSLDPNYLANPTKIEDIPIICRIVEANDE